MSAIPDEGELHAMREWIASDLRVTFDSVTSAPMMLKANIENRFPGGLDTFRELHARGELEASAGLLDPEGAGYVAELPWDAQGGGS